MPVTHCLCEKLSLNEILQWAHANEVTELSVIREHLGCSGHCGMCGPFIEYALVTGETVVPYPCPDLPLSKPTSGDIIEK